MWFPEFQHNTSMFQRCFWLIACKGKEKGIQALSHNQRWRGLHIIQSESQLGRGGVSSEYPPRKLKNTTHKNSSIAFRDINFILSFCLLTFWCKGLHISLLWLSLLLKLGFPDSVHRSGSWVSFWLSMDSLQLGNPRNGIEVFFVVVQKQRSIFYILL